MLAKNKENFFFEKIPSLLIILLPLTLITGPFLSDLSVSLVALIFIIYIIKNKKYDLLNNIFSKIFFLFWFYILFNSVFINFDLTSIKSSFFYFRFLFFCLAFSFLIKINNNLINKIFFSFLFSYTLLIFDGYFQYYFGHNIIGFEMAHGPRVSSFFGEELILGSYLSRLFPIFFGLTIFLYTDDKKKILLTSIIFILIEALVFLSGERTAFFYINLSAIFIILLVDKFKMLRLITLGCSFILIILIISFNDAAKIRIIDTSLDQMGFREDSVNNKKYIFSQEHQEQYTTAIKIFLDKPLFGAGIKKFRKECKNEKYSSGLYSCSTHPHNIYLQLLSETGIIGFLFIFSFFIIFLKYIIRHFICLFKKNPFFTDFEVCLLSAVFITIWPLSPNGNIFNNWLSIIYYFPVGILLWSFSKTKKKKLFKKN